MDFVDSLTGTADRRHPETDIGHRETEQGLGNFKSSTKQTHDVPPELPSQSGGGEPLSSEQREETSGVGASSQIPDDKLNDVNSRKSTVGTSVL